VGIDDNPSFEVQLGVGLSVSIAGAAGIALFSVFMVKRHRKRLENAQNEIQMDNPTFSDEKYQGIDAQPGITLGVHNNRISLLPGLEKKMHVEYKSLIMVKEIGSGSC
jgi:hypothetical protein